MGCGGSKTKEVVVKAPKFAFPKCIDTIQTQKEPSFITTSEDKNILVAFGNEVQKMDVIKHTFSSKFSEHTGSINCMIRLSSGLIVSAGEDKIIKVWNESNGECKGTLSGHKSMIWGLTETSNGNLLSVSDDKSAILWDLNKYEKITTLQEEKKLISACCSLKEGKVATGGGNKMLKIFDISAQKQEGELLLLNVVWSLLQLKDGRLAVGLGNGDIYIVDPKTMKKVLEFKGHSKSVNTMIEIDGGRLISGSDDGKIILWDLNEPESKFVFQEGHTASICTLIKLDDTKFASASSDSSIKIWE
ncbi:MAG: WD40 repeat domain-containing protein [archaeon]|nr:WD40 repeat domain-containing protein [archaeon]